LANHRKERNAILNCDWLICLLFVSYCFTFSYVPWTLHSGDAQLFERDYCRFIDSILLYFQFILSLLCIGLAMTSDLSGYKPRGWRPNGRHFNLSNNRLHAYYDAPGLQSYKPPDIASTDPLFTTTTRPRTTTVKTTTTPRNREPTTAPNEQPEDDLETTNPVLAIANSFAFNRPVYVYNAFPFLPAQIIT